MNKNGSFRSLLGVTKLAKAMIIAYSGIVL